MNCKSCGAIIPSALLSRDSFSCPKCGRAYRRNTRPSQSAPAPRKAAPAKSRPSVPARKSRTPLTLPKWLLPAVSGVLALALVVCLFLLLTGRTSGGAFPVRGILNPGTVAGNKSLSTTIEIPNRYGTDYIVAAETATSNITFSVKDKTASSFVLVTRNNSSKERSPKVTWVVIPYTHLDDG